MKVLPQSEATVKVSNEAKVSKVSKYLKSRIRKQNETFDWKGRGKMIFDEIAK